MDSRSGTAPPSGRPLPRAGDPAVRSRRADHPHAPASVQVARRFRRRRDLAVRRHGRLASAACLTVLFLCMRSVMDIGGSCASGGPYEIANPCPAGFAPD